MTKPSRVRVKGLLAEKSLIADNAPARPYPSTHNLQMGASEPPESTGPSYPLLSNLNASPTAFRPEEHAFEMPRQCPLIPSIRALRDAAMPMVVAGMR